MSNVSYFAIKTIFVSKIKEFFFDYQYTIISPLFSTLIFCIIFSTISNYYSANIEKNSYLEFVVPGIIIMVAMQISFGSVSENLINMKQLGTFNDYLISPISRVEILISLIITSLFMTLFISLLNISLLLIFFVEYNSVNFILSLYYLLLTSLIFTCLGTIVGFLSFTWDAQQSFANFFILPISFLSGTFFSIDSVNQKWDIFFEYNPFFLLVNNFRNSFFNKNSFILFEELILIILTLFILLISIFIYRKGYRVIN